MKVILKERKGKVALPAMAVLGGVAEELLHYRGHRLRHPFGIYNNSVGSLTERLNRLLELLWRPPPHTRIRWQSDTQFLSAPAIV